MDVTATPEPATASVDPFFFNIHNLIYRGRLHDGRVVAVKISPSLSWTTDRLRLLNIWAKCTHRNVVQLITKTIFRGSIAAVYEWHEYGSIRQYLDRQLAADRYNLSAQICEGVAYLHANNIIFGSLDGDQILVSRDGVPRIQLSIRTSSTQDTVIRGIFGRWSPPELIQGSKYTFASDVYSLGMETITRDEPYGANIPWSKLEKKVKNGEPPSRPTDIPENNAGNVMWDILRKCWSYDPEGRPSARHISEVIWTVHQTPAGLALRPRKLVVTEETTVHHLATYFAERGLMNYTEFLHPATVVSTSSIADTALANVYRVELLYHESIALKCVKHITPYKRLKRAARELACWSLHKHENILPLYGFAVLSDELAMVSPWINNGYVTEYVNRNPNCDRFSLCIQLVGAVAYLHENNVVHGDIKGPNVLISDAGTVLVTDFGVSIADNREIEFSLTSTGGGTQRWQAPEILLGPSDDNHDKNSPKDGDSSKEGDVYALGMTMIEIYTGDRPYGPMDWSGRMLNNIVNGRLRPSRPILIPISSTGNELWRLMTQCWGGDPNDRPKSGEVYRQLTSL